jgi:6-phosphogluconolactonase
MNPARLVKGVIVAALIGLASAAQAATFVYVSNAEDGNIGMYTLQPDGTLQPGARVDAGKPVMPMSVSPDKRFLFAAVRSKPFTVITYAIDPKTGALKQLSTAPLADSFPYILIDRTGRYLLGASYGGNLVSVNTVDKNGKVSPPVQ